MEEQSDPHGVSFITPSQPFTTTPRRVLPEAGLQGLLLDEARVQGHLLDPEGPHHDDSLSQSGFQKVAAGKNSLTI